jgi:hypothetical protein
LVIPALSSGTGLSSSHTTWDVVGWDSTFESKTQPKLGHDSSTNNLIRRYRKQREITP